MNPKPKLVVILILVNIASCFGQETSCSLKEKELITLSKDSLISLADSYYGDKSCMNTVFASMLKLGKRDRDTAFLAETYFSMAYFYDGQRSLAYSDSLMLFSSNRIDKRYAEGPYVRGTMNYYNDNPTEAIHNFQESYKRSLETGEIDLAILSLNIIGMLKSEYSNDKNAILLHHQAKGMLKKISNEKERADIEIYTNDKIAIYHLRSNNPDSALYYVRESQKLMERFNLIELEDSFKILEGQAFFYKKRYKKAKEILEPVLAKSDGIRRADILYYLGSIEEKIGNQKDKLKFFQRIDSIMANEEGPTDTTTEVYLYLLNKAKEEKNTVKQLHYYDQLIKHDSVLNANRIEIGNFDPPGYAIADLIKNRNELLENNQKKSNWILIFVILFFIAVITGLYFANKYNKAVARLQKQLVEEFEPIRAKHVTETEAKKINPAVEIAFEKLQKWEKGFGYLDSNITQTSLAKELKTNSTYLSKAVNEYKGQDFRRYLNDLRITNFINTTRKGYKMPKKSIISIIEGYGFNSIDSFSRALKLKLDNKDISPAMYVKEISKRNL